MKTYTVDSNSRPIPVLSIGYGATFISGVVPDEFSGNIVRFKAIGDTTFRLKSQPSSEILILDGETEYFFIPNKEQIEIVSGSLNIMK